MFERLTVYDFDTEWKIYKSLESELLMFVSPRMSHYTHVHYAGYGRSIAFSGQ